MIELYEKTQRDFSNHGHVLQDVYNDTVTWKINETFTLQFDYPLTSPHGFELTREKIITVPVPSTFEHNQAFRIYDVKKSMGVATVYARHVFWDLMQNLIEDTNVVDKNGQLALDQILGGGNYASEFEATSNLANTATARIVRMSVVSALIGTDDNTFLKRWGGEFEWDNWTFRVADKIGADRGVVFSNRKNLLGYTAEDNTDTVITRIMPEGYNGLFLPEKYVDSPLINNYLSPRVAVVPFTDIKAIDDNTASDDADAVPLEEAYELMRKAAAEKFSVDHIDEPSTTVSLNVVLLENSDEYKGKGLFSKVYPGDTARFVHDEDKMDTTAEMTGYTWSPVQGEYMTVTFESSATTTSPITGPTISSVARQVTSIDRNVIVKAQDGIHQTEWSDKDPTDADPGVDGDVWYVQDGSAITMWVHENGHWVLKNDDVTGQKIQKKVDDAFAQIPVLEANIETAMQLAQDNAAKFADQDASIKAMNDLVTGAKTDAANAADQAISALNSAKSAAADAASALQVAQGTNSDIKSIRTDVDDINATMSTLATDEKVNALTGTVNTVKTQSEQNANELLFKADQTVVTGISDKLNNLSVGSRNLLVGTGTISSGANSTGTSVIQSDYLGNATVIGDGSINPAHGNLDTYHLTTTIIPMGTVYTVGFYAKSETDGINIINYFYDENTTTGGINSQGYVITSSDGTNSIKLTTSWEKYWITWNQTACTKPKHIILGRLMTGNTSKIYINSPMLVEGNVPAPWVPAPEDNANLISDLTATVTKTSASLDITNQQLALKADKTVTDGINNTINDLSAEQKVQAGLISTMATKTYVDTSTAGMATESYVSGQIQVASDQITNTVEAVQNSVSLSGSRNYLLNSAFTELGAWKFNGSQNVKIDTANKYNGNNSVLLTATGTGNGVKGTFNQTFNGSFAKGDYLTVTFYAKLVSGTAQLHTELNGGLGNKTITLTSSWRKYTITFQYNDVSVFYFWLTAAGSILINSPMLVAGSTGKVWMLAPEDTATVTALTSVTQDVSSIRTIATNNQGDIATLTTKFNGYQVSVTSDIAGVKATQTTLADQYTSIIGDIGNMIRGGDFEDQTVGQSSPYWDASGQIVSANLDRTSASNPSATCLQISGIDNGNRDVTSNTWLRVKAGTQYSLTFKSRWGKVTDPGSILGYVFEYDVDKALIHPRVVARDDALGKSGHNWKQFSGTYTPADGVAYVKVDMTYNGGASNKTVWVDDIDFREDLANNTAITQLQGLIDANVTVAGKIAAQLSLSADGGGTALLAGNHVHITGATTIDSAVIKDGMIDSMSANKLTVGTIDASQINLINMNASNITTGSINANLITSGTINANLIKSGTIDASLIKGKVLASTSGASRWDLTNGTFESFSGNENGVRIVDGLMQFWDGVVMDAGATNASTMRVPKVFSGAISNGSGSDGHAIGISGNGNLFLQAGRWDDTFVSNNRDVVGSGGSSDKAPTAAATITMLGNNASNTQLGLAADTMNLSSNKNAMGFNIPKGAQMNGGVQIWGALSVSGAKNAIHVTRDGIRATPAYETAESYLGDIGENLTGSDCQVIVPIETLFGDVINSAVGYQVFLTAYSSSHVWVADRKDDYFVIKSDAPNAPFVWEIKGKRRGFETTRLVKTEVTYAKIENVEELQNEIATEE